MSLWFAKTVDQGDASMLEVRDVSSRSAELDLMLYLLEVFVEHSRLVRFH